MGVLNRISTQAFLGTNDRLTAVISLPPGPTNRTLTTTGGGASDAPPPPPHDTTDAAATTNAIADHGRSTRTDAMGTSRRTPCPKALVGRRDKPRATFKRRSPAAVSPFRAFQRASSRSRR